MISEKLIPFKTRGAMLMLGGISLVSSCATTYEGGGIVAKQCLPQKTEIVIGDGESFEVGVGDLSHTPGNIRDTAKFKNENGELKIEYPGGGRGSGERSIIGSPKEKSKAVNIIEENGVRLAVEVEQGNGETFTVLLDKTCNK